MDIFAIVVTDKRTNKIVFSEGISDSSSNVNIFIPRNIFTENEVELFKNDELIFHKKDWNFNIQSETVNIPSQPAYSLVCELEHLLIDVREYEVSLSSLYDSSTYVDNEITLLVAVHENSIVAAEGTDSDGYNYHQLPISDNYIKNDDMKFLKNDLEARSLCGSYDGLDVLLKHFLIK